MVRIDYPGVRVRRVGHLASPQLVDPAVSSWARSVETRSMPKTRSAGRALMGFVRGSSAITLVTVAKSRATSWSFQFVVKGIFGVGPRVDHVADPDGSANDWIGLQFKGPGMPKARKRSGRRKITGLVPNAVLPGRAAGRRRPGVFVCRPARASRRLPRPRRRDLQDAGSQVPLSPMIRTSVSSLGARRPAKPESMAAESDPRCRALRGHRVSDQYRATESYPRRRLDSSTVFKVRQARTN